MVFYRQKDSPSTNLPRKLPSLVALIFSYLLLALPLFARSEPVSIKVATAANFAPLLKELKRPFEESHNIKVQVISAATGTLYQQIAHGAPFDVFLSADSLRPEKLVEQGIAVNDSIRPYTIGQLSFYSEKFPNLTLEAFQNKPKGFGRLAIANPKFAPYGKAAQQVLESINVWQEIRHDLILGININQTFQHTRSQAAFAGIVATSQLKQHGLKSSPISTSLYQPIVQKAVILKRTQHLKVAQQFIDYLTSDIIQNELVRIGYLSVNQQIELSQND